MLAIAWLAWMRYAERRLRVRVEAIRARHEPLYPQDFAIAPMPPEQNAAAMLQAAAAAMVAGVDSPSMSSLTYPGYLPHPPAWHAMANAVVAADQPTLALARKARRATGADWGGGTFQSPVIGNFRQMARLGSARDLANLLGDAAEHAHLQDGDDTEGIERLRDLLHQSEILARGNSLLIGRLVSLGIEDLALARLQLIAPGLQITETAHRPTPATMPARAVGREVIQSLILQLLNERSGREARRHAMLGERMAVLDTALRLVDRSTILRPLFLLEAARGLDQFELDIRAVDQANDPASRALFATQTPALRSARFRSGAGAMATPADAPRFSRLLSMSLGGSWDRYMVTEWRLVAARRATVVSLAAQLYRGDHGRWPATLEALVPDYLPMVPRDPFFDPERPMGYLLLSGALPDGGDRPLVYFELDGKVNKAAPPAEPCYGWNRGDRQWVDLSRWSPTPTTAPAQSEQPGQDAGNKPL